MTRKMRALLVVAALLASLLSLSRSYAQIDPGEYSYGVYQNSVLVGEIFREDIDTNSYTEHWVLYPAYVYPSARNNVVTTLKPGQTLYHSLEDFFGHVPFARGSRYVSTKCSDGTTLPGR